MFNGARILVAPLDWGLGHASRCVPIIRRLVELGAQPVIGADKGPLELLRREFPDLEHVVLPGVEIRYGRGPSQLWSMARQFPAMVRSVHAERALFERLRPELRLNAVISDQRFGIRSPDLHSVLITHQVFPYTPFAQRALRRVNRLHISRFNRCWVMDEPEAPGLAGELSHGRPWPGNARYIGTVSRLRREGPAEGPYDTVAVISGPEPQRMLLEHRLISQLSSLPGRHLLVLGLPGLDRQEQVGTLAIRAHLDGAALGAALRGARLIISRSGYTTLMDLAALGRSALVVPTPGQLEQEYLGELHRRTGRFVVQVQEALDVRRALREALPPRAEPVSAHAPLLESALEELAAALC